MKLKFSLKFSNNQKRLPQSLWYFWKNWQYFMNISICRVLKVGLAIKKPVDSGFTTYTIRLIKSGLEQN